MKLEKLLFLAMVIALTMALSLAVACGDDDDDDDDDDDGDDDADDDDTSGNAAQEMMDQAYDACVQFWQNCDYDLAEEVCEAWVDSYSTAMEQFADTMDTECMMNVMNEFFECVGDDCEPDGAWATCNAAVEEAMLECFE